MNVQANRIYLPYEEAEKHILEGYVLLFRGTSIIARFIQSYGRSKYSHVGLASWSNGGSDPVLECLEFREFIGSRSVNLKVYSQQHPGCIDVFAPAYIACTQYFDPKEKYVDVKQRKFNGKTITRDFRRHIGKPYSYYQILNIVWYHTPILRFLVNEETFMDDTDDELNMAICSSAVAHFYSKHYADLVRFKSSAHTEPADIARSPLLSYLFTIS